MASIRAAGRPGTIAHQLHGVHRPDERLAAVIDADDLDEALRLAEDMTDIRAAEAARVDMRTTGETPIPWKQVKADLGLT